MGFYLEKEEIFYLTSDASLRLIGLRKSRKPTEDEKKLIKEYWEIVSKNIPAWQLLIQGKTNSSELSKLSNKFKSLNLLGPVQNMAQVLWEHDAVICSGGVTMPCVSSTSRRGQQVRCLASCVYPLRVGTSAPASTTTSQRVLEQTTAAYLAGKAEHSRSDGSGNVRRGSCGYLKGTQSSIVVVNVAVQHQFINFGLTHKSLHLLAHLFWRAHR